MVAARRKGERLIRILRCADRKRIVARRLPLDDQIIIARRKLLLRLVKRRSALLFIRRAQRCGDPGALYADAVYLLF